MNDNNPQLISALDLSREVLAAAERGDFEVLGELDAQRLLLLQSACSAAPAGDSDRALLREIFALNDRAIGLMEHHRRIKGRALDLAAVGRRAVAAYATNRAQR
jgi:hypothetical protein